MSRKSLEEILMKRDGISRKKADKLIDKCADALEHGDGEAIQYYLNLEDDYIFDVMGY